MKNICLYIFIFLITSCVSKKKESAVVIDTIIYKDVEIEQTVVQPDSLTERTYNAKDVKSTNSTISQEKKDRLTKQMLKRHKVSPRQ